MGQSIPNKDQPTYDQLLEIIRRKDRLVSGLCWNVEGLRAAAWLAGHAHDSGRPGYTADEYAGAASHLFQFLATQTRAVHDDFSDAHRGVSHAVLTGQPEGEETFRG